MKKYDLAGKRFGMLVVVKEAGRSCHGGVVWECKCDCGETKYICSHELVKGHSTSCGCKRKTSLSRLRYRHGDVGTRLYKTWQDMKSRCQNKQNKFYKDYGGRGISVCEEWDRDYIAFRAWAISSGYNDSLTIDRIDVNGNYEPNNCKWSTQYQQANNRRSAHFVTYHGKTGALTNMCRELNVNYVSVKSRMRSKGISFEEAVDMPPKLSEFKEYWKK